MHCKICLAETDSFAKSKILNKYEIAYSKCNNCGFIQTEEPYWLNDVYSEPINRSDVGLVSRSLWLAKIAKAVISVFFNADANFIDYGGGYGLFVRLMRDSGYDFYLYDKHCRNLFAKDFEIDINNRYELLTSFEVFEHLINPMDEIHEMLRFSPNILFTTELFPAKTPKPDEWWYYGLDHGQHISFYTRKSLSVIAENFSLNLYSNGKSVHLLTANKISPLLFNMISRHKVATLLNMIMRRKSLIQVDYKKITGKELS